MSLLKSRISTLPRSPEGHWDYSHMPIVESLSEYQIETILEIGFNNGFSATLFLNTLPIKKFYSLDIGYHPFVKPLQAQFEKLYEGKFFPFLESSMNIRDTPLNDMSFDLIFIDGWHKDGVPLNDFLFALDKCKYILLDDTGGNSPGVTDLINFINKGDTDTKPLIGNKVELLKNYSIGAGAKLYRCLETNKEVPQ